jgi:hypothetical protein
MFLTRRRLERLSEALRWPCGILFVAWRYLWQTTPLHRTEEPGDSSDLPGPIPTEADDDRIQDHTDGVGPLLHRRYCVQIDDAQLDADALMERLVADPNRWAPSAMAVFRRRSGRDGEMAVGDEFVVRLPGPWDGPVRVIASGPRFFRFATLRGHLEAGQIEFRTRPGPVFEIESWARPGDRLSHLLYNHLLLAKEIQLVMWTHACRRAARLAGGRPHDGLHVHTRRVERV